MSLTSNTGYSVAACVLAPDIDRSDIIRDGATYGRHGLLKGMLLIIQNVILLSLVKRTAGTRIVRPTTHS